jgi:hypothetical protein
VITVTIPVKTPVASPVPISIFVIFTFSWMALTGSPMFFYLVPGEETGEPVGVKMVSGITTTLSEMIHI